MATTDLKSFNYLENGEVSFSMFDTIKSSKTLDAGSYKINYIGYPENRVELKTDTDKETTKIHNFPDKNKIDKMFDSFFEPKVQKKMELMGFHHKVGILLYGREGTGKSTILKHYFSKAIEKENALVFHITTTDSVNKCWDFIMNIRRIQTNPIVIVFEEFNQQIENKNESFIKTILDGNMSINNCIFMATTNYIDTIPEAMKNRPSRFKYVLNIEGIQSKEEIYSIIHNFLHDLCNEKEIENYSNELKGKSLDTIKQFCIDKMMNLDTYTNKKSSIGFSKK